MTTHSISPWNDANSNTAEVPDQRPLIEGPVVDVSAAVIDYDDNLGILT